MPVLCVRVLHDHTAAVALLWCVWVFFLVNLSLRESVRKWRVLFFTSRSLSGTVHTCPQSEGTMKSFVLLQYVMRLSHGFGVSDGFQHDSYSRTLVRDKSEVGQHKARDEKQVRRTSWTPRIPVCAGDRGPRAVACSAR